MKERNIIQRLCLFLLTLVLAAPTWAQVQRVTLKDDGGTKYVDMPQQGINRLTLDGSVTTFKVYDDGGKDYYYGENCNGTLILVAPAGYLLQLSGGITTELTDRLTVYDSNGTNGTKLLDEIGSTNGGSRREIPIVYSTGQNLTLYFHSSSSFSVSDGLDLTVTLIDPNATYNVTVNSATGGSVVSSKAEAKKSDTVTLTATPESGYMLNSLNVVDGSNNAVAVSDMLWYTGQTTATFTMPAGNVSITPAFVNTLSADGGLYINMPKEGGKTATIPSGITSFKLYDDGGKDGNYSDNCSGTLVLTAPAGHTILLSGNIKTETFDRLTVYDNSEANGTKLLDQAHSSEDGTLTAIPDLNSTGRSMTLHFSSNGGFNYTGLDLTVRLVKPNITYNVTVNSATGGNVVSSKAEALTGETVTLTATPESGYLLNGLNVADADGKAVAVEGGTWYNNTATFTMPAAAVAVTPIFTNDLTSNLLYTNMPKTGSRTIAIPSGVTSFKVYDDGGKDGNYSDDCNGTLVLTAPAGYFLQLSGNSNTETSSDYLDVYDGSNKNAPQLFDGKHIGEDKKVWAKSTGQSMTLYFTSDPATNFEGLDLTVTVRDVLTLTFTPTLSFDTQTQKVWALTPPTVSGVPSEYTGKPTYSSSNEAAMRVDAEGRLMPGGNSCFGQAATITIHYPATAKYAAATASYTITVEADKTMPLASPADWQNFCNLVEGTSPHDGSSNPDAKLALDAKMTADIDLGSNIWTAGHSYAYYSGNFDGQGHALTVNWNTANEVYPFEYVEEATIKNLHVKGQITTERGSSAGLIGCIDGEATLSNITSEVDITSSYDGTCSLAGMVRVVRPGSNVTFNDCIVKGSITATTDGGKQGQAGFVYHQDGTCTLNNCLYLGMNNATGNSYTFAPNAILTNCHYLNSCGTAQGTVTTEEQLMSGEVTHLLQNGRTDQVWGQALGTDDFPLLTATAEEHVCKVDFTYNNKVITSCYANSGKAVFGDFPTAQEALGGNYNEHHYYTIRFENGFTTGTLLTKDTTVPMILTEKDYFEIASKEDWKEFCQLVNGGQHTCNGKLAADIDLGTTSDHGEIWSMVLGKDGDEEADTYGGTLDGDGHTITLNWTTSFAIGLIYNAVDASVKNLRLEGSLTSDKNMGGLMRFARGTINISNCWMGIDFTSNDRYANKGGFIGYFNAKSTVTFRDCVVSSKFEGTATEYWGGFIGSQYGNGTFTNCLYLGTNSAAAESYTFARYSTFTNCYYLNACGTEEVQGTQVTEQQLKSGEMLGKLGSAWAQVLGEMPGLYNEADKGKANYVYYDTAENRWMCDHVQIADGTPLPVGLDFTAQRVTNSRTLATTEEHAFTMCLPYAFTLPAHAQAYELESVTVTTAHFKKVAAPVLAANTPYLVVTASDVSLNATGATAVAATPAADVRMPATGSFALWGTLRGQTHDEAAAAKAYILQGDGKFHKVAAGNEGAVIPPYRCYITTDGPSGTRSLSFSLGDGTTGITTLSTTDHDGTVRYYDLQGRYIGTTLDGQPKGVYIGNGKKVMKK